MILTHRYRLLPSKRQHLALAALLEAQRQLTTPGFRSEFSGIRFDGRRLRF